METLLHVAIGAGGGALGGAVAGFVAAVLALMAKRWRNGKVMARGEPGWKDCSLPTALVPLCGFAGFVLGAALGGFLAPVRAAAIGALAPAGLLALLSVGFSVAQAYRD